MYINPDGTTSAEGMNVITEIMDCRYETVLLAAMKYALCLEEGDAVDAVIGMVTPRIPYLSNGTLAQMLTEVESYCKRGMQYEFDAKFLNEWGEFLMDLIIEREQRAAAMLARMERMEEEEDGEG